jgi:diguanylate cyclase (GGDEF)-like protein/PAS domain S-box-containing protein
MPIAGTLPSRNRGRSGPVRLFLMCGVLLIAAVATGTGLILSNLRERALSDSENALQNIALVVAEQANRALQAIDLVQTGLIERMQALGVTSGAAYERQMSGHDVHLMLKDKIAGLPHIDGITIINAQGKLINLSRSWPIPEVDVSDRDYFKALQSNPQLSSFVSSPVRNPGTGMWTVYYARKFVAPDGAFLGLVLGDLKLQYFEKLFGTLALGDGSAVALFRHDGVLLVRYPPRESPGRSYAGSDLFKKMLAGADRGVLRQTSVIDGTERLVAGHRLADYPIVVGVATTVTAALAGWRSATVYMTGTAVLLILVIGVTILLSIRQIKNYELLAKARAEKDQKMRLDAALNNMRQGLQMYDANGSVVLTNQKYLKMYGLPPNAANREWTIRDVLHLRKSVGTLAEDPDQFLKTIDHGKVEARVVQLPDGRKILVTNAPVPDGGWVSTHDDITESKRREASFRLLFESNPLPMWVYDIDTFRFLAVNDAAVAHYGFSRERFLAMTVADIRPVEDRERLAQFVRSTPGTQEGEELWRHRKADGTEIEVAIYSRALRYEGRAAVLVAIRDVTEQRRAEMERARSEERITHLAHHDMLTDLPNRLLFSERLDQALARVHRGERLAVLYLDLDDFKCINDTLGHPIGDELLKAVADRLRNCVREIDTLARLGGDEFAIVQASLEQPSDAAALATRIRETIRAPYLLDGHKVEVDVSIGIAVAPNDGIERDELLKNADMALYGGKTAGRGMYCFFEPEMNERMKARLELERDLRRALVGGEFELFYQPLVNVQDNEKISGFEALLRWRHPERGMIAPSEFISIAEEIGVIVPLGEWVLRTACAEAATWPDDIKIAVNLSPAQLTGHNLVQLVISSLASSGLPARRLELEITELVLMQNTFATLDTLHQLRELGVRIAMDDFGTGHSSLSYLLSFPFDKIKIDRCFIKGLPDENNCLAIVRAIAGLASSLHMTTTAEGVETESQLEMVKALGCTEMQGYIFSPPRPAGEISRLFLLPAESVANVA